MAKTEFVTTHRKSGLDVLKSPELRLSFLRKFWTMGKTRVLTTRRNYGPDVPEPSESLTSTEADIFGHQKELGQKSPRHTYVAWFALSGLTSLSLDYILVSPNLCSIRAYVRMCAM